MTTDIWRTHGLYGLTFSILCVGVYFGRRYGWLAGAALAYALSSSLWIFHNPIAIYGLAQIRMDGASARSFAGALLVPLTVALSSNRRWLWLLIELLVLIDCVLVLTSGYGLIGASSADTAFIAMAVPALWFRPSSAKARALPLYPYWAGLNVALPILAILWVPGSTAYFTLAAGLAGVALAGRSINIRWAGVAVIVALGVGYLREGSVNFLSPSDRVSKWQLFMNWWFEHANPWLGTGGGTFEWLGFGIQSEQAGRAVTENVFVWMHNEYLQVLFEQGIIGLLLFGGLWIRCLIGARPYGWLFGSMTAASVCFLTQFPIRFFTPELLLSLVMVEILCARKIRNV